MRGIKLASSPVTLLPCCSHTRLSRGPSAAGAITCTFRRWKRRQVVPGRRYRVQRGFIEVDSVEEIAESDITAGDATRAGFGSRDALLENIPGEPTSPLYASPSMWSKRKTAGPPSPRQAQLSDDDVRLDRE